MRVEILAVGTELLLGDVVNTNAAWLGRQLAAAGLDVLAGSVVGDNVPRIVAALSGALDRADAVVVSGGLGPTQDDLTRDALADLAGVPLRRDDRLAEGLRAHFAALDRPMPGSNLRQADLPYGAEPLANRVGSAPGLRLAIGPRVVYALPGVPAELTAMFADEVLPDLLARAGDPAVIRSRALLVAGRGESSVAEALGPLVDELEPAGNPTLAFLAAPGTVTVRLTVKAADPAAVDRLLGPVERRVRDLLGADVYGTDGDTLAGVVGAALRARSQTVAVAESLTGGLLGGLLSELPGSSDYFRGGVISYATDAKSAVLGVPAELLAARGPVDPDVAEAMAVGARRLLGADWGIALTGVAGPDRQGDAEVGTVWVGLADAVGSRSRRLRLPGDRSAVRYGAARAALDGLRRTLIGEG